MDPISILTTIYNIALKFKETAEKVQENKERCLQIVEYVELIRNHLNLPENDAVIRHESMRTALHILKRVLQKALGLITECQKKLNIHKANSLSRKLDEVDKEIQQFLNLAILIITLRKGQVQPAPLKEDHNYSSKNKRKTKKAHDDRGKQSDKEEEKRDGAQRKKENAKVESKRAQGKQMDKEVVEENRDAAAQKAERKKEKAQVKSKKAQDDRRRDKDVVEEKEDHNYSSKNKRKSKKAHDDRGKQRDKEEEKRDGAERKKENAEVESKSAQGKQRDKEVAEENRDAAAQKAERKKEKAQVKSKKAQDDRRRDKDVVEEKEDHNYSSKKVEEGHHSCSSRCTVCQLKALINDLSEKNIIIIKQGDEYTPYKEMMKREAVMARRMAMHAMPPPPLNHHHNPYAMMQHQWMPPQPHMCDRNYASSLMEPQMQMFSDENPNACVIS